MPALGTNNSAAPRQQQCCVLTGGRERVRGGGNAAAALPSTERGKERGCEAVEMQQRLCCETATDSSGMNGEQSEMVSVMLRLRLMAVSIRSSNGLPGSNDADNILTAAALWRR